MSVETGKDSGVRARVTARGEEALGKLVQDLLENPVLNGALTRAFEARGKAAAAQEATMGFLGIPSAADMERLTRRLRSVSQRLESIEDALVRVEEGIRTPSGAASLERIEERLAELGRLLGELRGDAPAPVSPDQERLRVEGAAHAARGGGPDGEPVADAASEPRP